MPSFDDVLRAQREMNAEHQAAIDHLTDLLDACRARRAEDAETGVQLAPAVTDLTGELLWIPWVSGSGTYMLAGLIK